MVYAVASDETWRPIGFGRIRRWAIWTKDPRAIALLLGVELGAIALAVGSFAAVQPRLLDTGRFAILLVLAIGYAEATDRVERLRRYLGTDGRIWSNHTSVWAVAGVLVLPAGLADLLVLSIYAHVFVLGYRHQSLRPHRMAFTAAAMLLATVAASRAVEMVGPNLAGEHGLRTALLVVVAVATLHVVDLAVLTTGVYLTTRPALLRMILPNREAVVFELVTQVLGLVAAQFLCSDIWMTPVVLVLLAVLHRASMVKELRVAATTDPKTSLLNPGGWRERVHEALSRATREGNEVALLLIDLDHFKLVNDEHGHLAGDRVLGEVASCLRRESRAHDIVGRFGGEEFVVFIDGGSPGIRALDVAERLRAQLASIPLPDGIRITASIGVTHGVPTGPADLDAMLEAADRVLYQAKAAGRNRVHAVRIDNLARR